jgi:hypothetical protein
MENDKQTTKHLEKLYNKNQLGFFKENAVTDDFLSKYADQISIEEWEDVVKKNDLGEDLIVKYANEIGWTNILKYQKMSLSFMVKYEITSLLHLPYYISLLKENKKIDKKTKEDILMISKML